MRKGHYEVMDAVASMIGATIGIGVMMLVLWRDHDHGRRTTDYVRGWQLTDDGSAQKVTLPGMAGFER